MAGADDTGDSLGGIEIPYSQLVLGIEGNQSVGGEVEGAEGCAPWRLDGLLDSVLAEDEDFTGAKLGFVRSDGEKRLDWIVS